MKRITKEQASVIGLYTGITCGPFSDVHKLAEEIMGRPIFTHEFANDAFVESIQEKIKPMFLATVYKGE